MRELPCEQELEHYFCFNSCNAPSNYSAMISAMRGVPAGDQTISSDDLLDAIGRDRKVFRALKRVSPDSYSILAAYYISPRIHTSLSKYGSLAAVASLKCTPAELLILLNGAPATKVAEVKRWIQSQVKQAHDEFSAAYQSERRTKHTSNLSW